MPIRWTPEKDQILLLKILETANVSVNTEAVVNAWRTGELQDPSKSVLHANIEVASNEIKPTPRAVTERLFKLRRINGIGASADGVTVSKGNGETFGPPTPRKRKVIDDSSDGSVLPSTEGGTPKKRGRGRPRKIEAMKQDEVAEKKEFKPEPVVNHHFDEDAASDLLEMMENADFGHGNGILDGLKEEMSDSSS